MESKNYGTVICGECGTRVDIDDAEASYNAELDDVVFYCSKCIYNPAYLPVVSDDGDEAVEHVNAADGAKAEPVCNFFGCADPICEADKGSPNRMHFCQNHHDQLQGYIERHEIPKILGFWVKANGGAKRLAETF